MLRRHLIRVWMVLLATGYPVLAQEASADGAEVGTTLKSGPGELLLRLERAVQSQAQVSMAVYPDSSHFPDRHRIELVAESTLRAHGAVLPSKIADELGCLTVEVERAAMGPLEGPPAGYRTVGECGQIVISLRPWSRLPLELLPVVIAHEGWLGHHFFELQQDVDDVPPFGREIAGEAWAIFAESLALELNLLPDSAIHFVGRHRILLFREALTSADPDRRRRSQLISGLLLHLEESYAEIRADNTALGAAILTLRRVMESQREIEHSVLAGLRAW